MGFPPLAGVVAQVLTHVMLEEEIATMIHIVLEISTVETTIAKEIIHQMEVIGQVLLIVAKVSRGVGPLIKFLANSA